MLRRNFELIGVLDYWTISGLLEIYANCWLCILSTFYLTLEHITLTV